MKKRQPFTWDEHEALGAMLATFSNDTFGEAFIEISNHYGTSAKETRAARRVLNAIDNLRSLMDSRACNEHDEPDEKPQFLYYPLNTART